MSCEHERAGEAFPGAAFPGADTRYWQETAIEARAEVERLKDSVATLDKLYVSRTDALRESEAEVERLREAVRQVHALAAEAVAGTAVGTWLVMQEIHKITKGMVGSNAN